VGIRDGADWAVRSGLEDGDEVITEGVQRMAPGMQIEIDNSL
jgi:multidrug efflux pump subunit AcrA (membrane-fusion protein)